MINVHKQESDTFFPLTTIDVVTIFLVLGLSGGLITAVLYALLGNWITVLTLSRYVGGITGILLPIIWIDIRYNLSKKSIGIRKGNFSLPISLSVGILTASLYFVLCTLITTRSFPVFPKLSTTVAFIQFILLPFFFQMFPIVVLVPLSEEILFRGLLYGYLRLKLKVFPALLLQGALFSLMHVLFNRQTDVILIVHFFIIGIVLGFIYQKMGTLYSSFACHITFNYLNTLLMR
jgi:hypothetical protein